MKTIHRILFGPTVAGLFLVICGLVAFNAISQQQQALQEINEVRFENMRRGAGISDEIARIHTDMFRLISWYNSFEVAKQTEMKDQVGKDLTRVSEQLRQWLDNSVFTPQERQQLSAIAEALKGYGEATEAAIFMVFPRMAITLKFFLKIPCCKINT